VFIATGTGGKGILMGPVIGKAIADLVMNGETDLKIGQFGLARFAAN
jgi:glycine/D-amino acid oxidase-like deaminating enzyme